MHPLAAISPWLDKHADPEWRHAHRFWSVQISVVAALVSGIWTATPAFQSWFPPLYFGFFCMFMALLALAARLVDQKFGTGDGP